MSAMTQYAVTYIIRCAHGDNARRLAHGLERWELLNGQPGMVVDNGAKATVSQVGQQRQGQGMQVQERQVVCRNGKTRLKRGSQARRRVRWELPPAASADDVVLPKILGATQAVNLENRGHRSKAKPLRA